MSAPAGIPLQELRACFESVIPAALGSVSAEGVPNVSMVSIVRMVDDTHVGVSRQFFNKTAANIAANPRAQVLLVDPRLGYQFRLDLRFEGTVIDGPLFEQMRAELASIASQSGMASVFKLSGIDIYEVLDCQQVPASGQPRVAESADGPRPDALAAFASITGAALDVEDLIGRAMDAMGTLFGYEHAILLVPDETDERLYTIASRGYTSSGAGSEVPFGVGHIGTAAATRSTIRTTNSAKDRIYTQAVRLSVERAGRGAELDREIPLPGLPEMRSQLVTPVVARGRLLAVICLQSEEAGRFTEADEQAMGVAASQLGLLMALLRLEPTLDATTPLTAARPSARAAVEVRHFALDDSIFIDNEYLIKGIAGRILWRLLGDYMARSRVDFTNKEMRLDASLELPDIKDNLEARLILLRRRLEDRGTCLHITKTGRGRFRLAVDQPIVLREEGGW